jgi:TctA family transporter
MRSVPLMGWGGLIFLGAVIGAAGWWLHPLRRAGRAGHGAAGRIWTAIAAGIVATVVARMLGNIVGVYHDGDTLEWFSCALFALAVVTAAVASSRRR